MQKTVCKDSLGLGSFVLCKPGGCHTTEPWPWAAKRPIWNLVNWWAWWQNLALHSVAAKFPMALDPVPYWGWDLLESLSILHSSPLNSPSTVGRVADSLHKCAGQLGSRREWSGSTLSDMILVPLSLSHVKALFWVRFRLDYLLSFGGSSSVSL